MHVIIRHTIKTVGANTMIDLSFDKTVNNLSTHSLEAYLREFFNGEGYGPYQYKMVEKQDLPRWAELHTADMTVEPLKTVTLPLDRATCQKVVAVLRGRDKYEAYSNGLLKK